MALIKCSVCGGEMSDQAKFCPKCGSENKLCPNCGEQVAENATICSNCGINLSHTNIKTTVKRDFIKMSLGIALCVIGVIAFAWGVGNVHYNGDYASREYYGGDAYTGMQHASATTANNVDELGDLMANSITGMFMLSGLTLIVVGTYFIIVGVRRKEQE